MSPPKAVGTEAAVVATFRSFEKALQEAGSIQELREFLSADSTLGKSADNEESRQIFEQYQLMLSRFKEQSIAVELTDDQAEVVVQGKAPVDDPRVRSYLDVAAATYRATLVRQGDQWKISNARYKMRLSD